MKSVTIWSRGTRMAGSLYAPSKQEPGVKYPAVVCCHGWSAPLRQVMAATDLPQRLADAGYFVLIFDYRGWGDSDGMIVTEEKLPPGATEATMKVKIVRNLFDPLDWVIDIDHAIDFIEGEPGVDPDRIGLWGSSVGGGLVIWVAANDPRIKCVVSQAGAHDYRGVDHLGKAIFPAWSQADMRSQAIRQARDPRFPVPTADNIAEAMGGMMPGPVDAGARRFAPVEWAHEVKAPTLILDADDEPLFDKGKHAIASLERIKAAGQALVEYDVIPNTTHGADLYEGMTATGIAEPFVARAVDWFKRHL